MKRKSVKHFSELRALLNRAQAEEKCAEHETLRTEGTQTIECTFGEAFRLMRGWRDSQGYEYSAWGT